MGRFWLWVISFAVFAGFLSAALNGQSPRQAGTTQPAPKTAHAEWSPFVQDITGVTREEFTKSGLSKLTPTELNALFEDVLREQAYRNTQYICEPRAPNYEKVKVMVTASDKAESQIVSAIRQRLRSVPDVEIVYSSLDADLLISVLAVENELESGRRVGYAASVVTSVPCHVELGPTKWDEESFRGHLMQVGGNATELADRIVSTLDTNDLEAVRSHHAAERQGTHPQ